MDWFRVDCSILDHPKFVGISPSAFMIWVAAMGWCNKHRTDGYFDERSRTVLVPRQIRGRHVRDAFDDLVERRLMYRVGSGYQIHNYTEYQRSRAEIEAISEKRRAAARKRHDANCMQVAEPHHITSQHNTSQKKEKTPKPPAKLAGFSSDNQIREVQQAYIDQYPQRARQAKTEKSKRLIKARLGDGYSPGELCEAIVGNAASEFHAQGGYNGLALILRDADHVDRFIAQARNPNLGRQTKQGDWSRARDRFVNSEPITTRVRLLDD